MLPFYLLCLTCASAQIAAVKADANAKKSDVMELRLKDSVKRMEIAPALGAGGLKEIYVFDETGNVVEQSTVYRRDNRVYTKTVNSFDRSERKISSESFQDGKLETKSIFNYEKNGKASEQIDYDAEGKLLSKTASKYDDNGNLIETNFSLVQPISGGMLAGFGIGVGSYKIIYGYDENGNPKQTQFFLPNEKVADGNQLFVYNRENQKIEETSFTPTYENKLPRVSKHFYAYNKQGDVVETKSYEPINESNVETVRDRFKIVDAKGTVQNGLLISDKAYMILWDVTVCDYEYDARGNWTKQICKWKTRDTKDFVPTADEATQRIITYY